MLTSHSDSDFECSNISLKGNKLDTDDLDYCIQKNTRKILWFSADCIKKPSPHEKSNLTIPLNDNFCPLLCIFLLLGNFINDIDTWGHKPIDLFKHSYKLPM